MNPRQAWRILIVKDHQFRDESCWKNRSKQASGEDLEWPLGALLHQRATTRWGNPWEFWIRRRGLMILSGGEKDVCILELPSWFWLFKMACFRLRNDLSLFLRDLLPRFMSEYVSAQGLPTLQAQNYESVDSPIHALVDPEIPSLHIFVSLPCWKNYFVSLPCWKNYVQAKWIQPAWILTRMVLEGTRAAMWQKECYHIWPFWAMCFAAHSLAFKGHVCVGVRMS